MALDQMPTLKRGKARLSLIRLVAMKKIFLCLLLGPLILIQCTGPPEGVKPVEGFELSRYVGKWYEIARLDHSFERGLSNVSAHYGPMDEGGIAVMNRGFDEESARWKEVRGRAYFIGEVTKGSLKVSFFGPFYGGYHVIALDHDNYSYAVVCGPNRSYLWILSRQKTLAKPVLDRLIRLAADLGFPTNQLIYVQQDRAEP